MIWQCRLIFDIACDAWTLISTVELFVGRGCEGIVGEWHAAVA